jgi:hypothetical protein
MEISALGDEEAVGRMIALVPAEGAVCWHASGFALIPAMVRP